VLWRCRNGFFIFCDELPPAVGRGARKRSKEREGGGRISIPLTATPPRSLSPRGTSGERAGERGAFHRFGAATWNPLSLTLSPLLRRGERESTRGMVIVSRLAPEKPALPPA